ncbi:head completion/stabilization protein, partial [Vibrio azureus]
MFDGKPSPAYQDTDITNDGFWPDLNVGDFEKRRGIPAQLDSEAVAMALVAAMSQINIELSTVKAHYQARGVEKASLLERLPMVLGKNSVVVLYEKAVFARAKSAMVAEFASLTTKD